MVVLSLQNGHARKSRSGTPGPPPGVEPTSVSSTGIEPFDEPVWEAIREPGLSSEARPLTQEQLWLKAARAEIDDYLVRLKTLCSLDPAEVFLQLSAISARLAELRIICVRSESRRLAAFRTRELDPLMEMAELQFRLYSRIQACRTVEFEMSKGQV